MKLNRVFLFVLGFLAVLSGAGCTKEARTARHLENGDKYFAAGRYDEAELEYLSVLKTETLNTRAISQLGLMFFGQGRYGRVLPFLVKTRDLAPDNLENRRFLGLMYIAYGNNAEARAEALYILGKNPADTEAPIMLAESSTAEKDIADARKRLQELPGGAANGAAAQVALATIELRARNFREAEALLKRAEAADPQLSAVHSAWGSFYMLQNDRAKAEPAYAKAAELTGPRSSKKVEYAQFKLLTGDVAGAEKYLDDMIKLVPDYIPALITRAQLEAGRRNFDAAEPFITRALQRDGLHPEALFIDIQIKTGRGELAKAITAAENALRLYPNSAKLHYAQAIAHVGMQDTVKAVASLNAALALFPKYSEAVLLLAEIDIRRGEPNAAAVSLRQLLRDRPELIQGWLLLANALRKQGDLEGTAGVYRNLVQLAPRNPDPYLLLGAVLGQQNKLAEARQMLEKSLEVAPRYVLPFEELINLDIRERKFADSRARVEKRLAEQATPAEQSKLNILLAKVEVAAERPQQAEVALLRAIQLQPESPIAYLLLAQLYINGKREDEALANLDKVVEKDARNVQAFMLRGVIQEQKQDYKGAAASYEKLVAVDPRFAPALNNLAWISAEYLGQLDKGVEFAKRARDVEPNDPRVTDTLGWLLFRKGQYAEALVLLQQAAGAMPDEPTVQYHLAMTHYMMGTETAARTAFQRSVDSKASFAERADAQQRLTILALNPSTAGSANLAALEKMVAERKDDPVALNRLAAAYANSGASDKALRTYQTALTVSPRNAKATLELARLHAAGKDNAKALELAKAARKLAPDDPEAAQELGKLAMDTGDHAWALSLLQEAARARSNDAQLQYDLGRAQFANGRVTEAEATMRRVTTMGSNPRVADARQFLEFAAAGANPAAARIQQALAATPDYVPALAAQAGQAERAGDTAAAIRHYEAILKLYPEFAPAKRSLVILYAKTPANDQRAFDLAVKARETYVGDAELAKAFGTVLYRRKDYPRAVSVLQESASSRSNDAEVLYYLGLSQQKANRAADSRQNLQKAVSLGLAPDMAAEAAKALKDAK